MSQFSTPEGYLPYRLFTYPGTGTGVEVALRPEQFTGAVKGVDQNTNWRVDIAMKDGGMSVPFGRGPDGESQCRKFIAALAAFMEADALRNAHNAVMRKGKFNGG